MSLWLDQLFNETIENKVTFEKLYKLTSIITLIVSRDAHLQTFYSNDVVDDPVAGNGKLPICLGSQPTD